MNPKHSYWPKREQIVRDNAGKIPAAEIAELIGISTSRLRHMCALKGISLKVPGLRSKLMVESYKARSLEPEPMKVDINALWKRTSIRSIS